MRRQAFLLMVAVGAAVLLASGVALAATTQTFSNTATITINDDTTATPYPSPISVSGVTGSLKDVDVILNGFSHTFPDDVDILLEGPQGQKALIMSDAGNGCERTDLTIRLKDEARRALPNERCLASKSYKPKDHDANPDEFFCPPSDSFPAPAPAEPYASKLNAFDGTDPNGTWNLYVVDDCDDDVGEITTGWSLVIKAG